MEEAESLRTSQTMELLEVKQSEETPLAGGDPSEPSSAGEPSPAQAKKEGPWSSCNKILIGKCRVWMAITSIFLGLIILIIISLCLVRVTYRDEDENEIPELSSNKTFLIMLKIPDECVTEEELPHLLTKRVIKIRLSKVQDDCPPVSQPDMFRNKKEELSQFLEVSGYGSNGLTDVYSSSPSLSRYFTSVEIADFSGENATITYHLLFGVPSGDERFLQYMMSDEVVLSILRQDFHDQNVPGCEALGLDPTSLFPYE